LDLNTQIIQDFQQTVLSQGKELYREMPWRTNTNPYYILLSEIMLQQTQVPRVLVKFDEFISAFPTINDLAEAPFEQVLELWTGLGYNRRARFLHSSAQIIVEKYNGVLPKNIDDLIALPGIGPNTAASILAYSYNLPTVFVETNIRTVLIFTFFPETAGKIDEKLMVKLAQQTLYAENPRQWYWALMDYGVFIKKTEGNFNKLSKSYNKQSKFEGSKRQKRASILRLILQEKQISLPNIVLQTEYENDLCAELVTALVKDNLVEEKASIYSIKK